MRETRKPVLDVLQGHVPERMPIWLMRQAGRYLPEYRDLRAKAKNFLNLCLTPDYAVEITLQPIRRFDFDAAILFADILLVPMALGADLNFVEGEGPVLDKIADEKAIARLSFNNGKLLPVYETLLRVKAELPAQTTLIGFCGAPWTVACYMIDGNSKTDFALAKQWARQEPSRLRKLIDVLIESSAVYLCNQIEAGAEVVQIFDSWAGLLQGDDFKRLVIEPIRELVKRVKKKHPHIPIIGFPREAGDGYLAYVNQTGVDCLSLDQKVNLDDAAELRKVRPLQGNLDPALLLKGGADMKAAAEKIMRAFGPRHIFNLGHGVTPDVPVQHVAELVKIVRDWKA